MVIISKVFSLAALLGLAALGLGHGDETTYRAIALGSVPRELKPCVSRVVSRLTKPSAIYVTWQKSGVSGSHLHGRRVLQLEFTKTKYGKVFVLVALAEGPAPQLGLNRALGSGDFPLYGKDFKYGRAFAKWRRWDVGVVNDGYYSDVLLRIAK